MMHIPTHVHMFVEGLPWGTSFR